METLNQTSQTSEEDYWLECIKSWYPELHSRTYFLPPIHFNITSYRTQDIAGHEVSVPLYPQDCDVRGDRAQELVLLYLRALANTSQQTDDSQHADNTQQADNSPQTNNTQQIDHSQQIDNSQKTGGPQQTDNIQTDHIHTDIIQTDNIQTDNSQQTENPRHKEVMMVISQLQFGKYLGEPSYAAAVALLPRLSTLPEKFRRQHYDEGEFDVLIIHKRLGLLTLEIKSVGGNFSQLAMTEEKEDDVVMRKVKDTVKQLNKAEVVLKHLTSDIPAITHITKILVLPNISSAQLIRAINRFPSDGQDLCKCLGVQSVDDAVKLCLLSDQLPDKQPPVNINTNSLQALEVWWQHVVLVSGQENLLTSPVYEQLVARFCGPATTVEVYCDTPPHLNIRTLGEAVSETGERVARLVLFPQQVDILNQSPSRAFLTGPPGTGKTTVLIMQGLTWLQRGYDVHVVSTCDESRAVTFVIEHQLQETVKTSTARSRVYRHQFDLTKDGENKIAARHLKSLSEGRQLCVIADEAVFAKVKDLHNMIRRKTLFKEFCDELINEVHGVYIWSASVHHDMGLSCLKEFKLTAPLRSPPVVIREVMEADQIKREKQVHDYMISDVPVPTDGPPVIRIKHRDGQSGHIGDWPRDCVKCGHQVVSVLIQLNVGRTVDSNIPPRLQYRDVLVLCLDNPTNDRMDSNGQVASKANGLIQTLRDQHVPVRVIGKGDEAAIRDTALGVGDLVTVAHWEDVRGLERKVVVVESGIGWFNRLHARSRCMSQLVLMEC